MAGTTNGQDRKADVMPKFRDSVAQRLEEREISFATLARIAPVGILRFDEAGRCNYANDRWLEMTGLTIDDAIGDGWINAIHIEDRANMKLRWEAMRHSDKIFREEYRFCLKDGSIRWVAGEGAALRGYAGEPLGFIRAVTDITRHRQLEEELVAASQALEERVRERTAELQRQIADREGLEKEVLAARDEEQKRFSQDLHDGLGQHLIGIEFRISALLSDLERANSPFADSAREILELIKDASDQAHDLARGVHPVPLRPDGLMTALQALVEKACRLAKVDCHFECDEPVHIEDNTVSTHLYRIAQEAITNAMKSGRPSAVVVRLRKMDSLGEMAIKDDGQGFETSCLSAGGRGLNIMRHRARLIGGTLDIKSSPGLGTTVFCRFPLQRSSATLL